MVVDPVNVQRDRFGKSFYETTRDQDGPRRRGRLYVLLDSGAGEHVNMVVAKTL